MSSIMIVALVLMVAGTDAMSLRRGFVNSSSVAALHDQVDKEQAPLGALLAEIQSRQAAADAGQDPELKNMNWRLQAFSAAIHHKAQVERAELKAEKKAGAKMGTKKITTKVKAKTTDYSEGHQYEHIADDKVCGESADMGEEKGVYEPKDCMKLCGAQADCTAFAFIQKPYKMCQFFSQCTSQKDANVIRGFKLFALKDENDDIFMGSTCGAMPTYPNSRPSMSKGNKMGESTVPFAFMAEDKVKYECKRDTNTDGSKDGPMDFDVECKDGYWAPSKRGCVEKSECGPLPCLRKAHITGKTKGTKKNPIVEMVCDIGYSLDGEKVIQGGEMKNALLNVECDFAGQWMAAVNHEGKKGKTCEPFAFVPASGMIKMYNKVFEVLFVSSCNKELAIWAQNKEQVPPKLDDGTVCSDFVADDKEGDCKSLVSDLKTLFEEAEGHDDNEGEDGEKGASFDASGFCKDMWDLLKMEEPAALTEC